MPSTFENVGFETAGAAAGLAAGWTLAWRASAEETAGYGAPERPAEGFERGWAGNDGFLRALQPTMVLPAFFDRVAEPLEDFEEGWSLNEAFVREIVSSSAADYGRGPDSKLVEDFDGLWAANEDYKFALAPVDLEAAATERFEAGWRNNEAFLFDFSSPSVLEPADVTTQLGPVFAEGFESLWPTAMATV